ncbi:MAG: O-antigen ligase family protein [Croceimicrobium sp.]
MPQWPRIWTKLFFASLIYYILLMPWQMKWLPITLGIMTAGLFWLLETKFRAKFKRLAGNKYAALLFASYLLVVLGSFYSEDTRQASKEMFSKIPILVWPLMLGSLLPFGRLEMDRLFKIFIYSVSTLVLASFLFAIYRYFTNDDAQVFYFTGFLSLSKVPPHYMGMYVTFAYALVLYRLVSGNAIFKKRSLNVALLVLLALAIVFIWVRMQYLLFIFVNAYILVQYVKAKRGRKQAIASLLGLVILFGSLLVIVPGSRSRLIDTYHELRSFEQMIENKQTNPRKFLWVEGVKVIKENFWTGVGTGAENAALNDKIEKVDAIFWDGSQTYQLYEMRFNYHNSFLQIFAANGVFAFLIFIALLLWPFFDLKGHPYRTEVRLFLWITILSFFTESMLQRQAGVLFFAFFYTLLIVQQVRPKEA